MLTEIQAWLADIGVQAGAEVEPMTPGLGHTRMWRIPSAGGDRDLVLRVFPASDARSRDRETLAMRATRAAGLPVPEVVTTGAIGDHPAMLVELVPGTTVADAIGSDRERAMASGRTLGRLLGEINRLPAPEGLAPAEAWLNRAGTEFATLHDRLRAMPHPDRLLHLDFHPQNVLMAGGAVTGIIDWTNTLPGPPHIDLGRSRAILGMVPMLPNMPPEMAATLAQLRNGLVAGHEGVHGPDPDPDLSLAYGFGMICVDFAPQATRPGSWVTPALVATLTATRDALIARVLAS